MANMTSWRPWEGVAADTLVSTTEVEPHPGPYAQTMFADGLVMENTRDPGTQKHEEAMKSRKIADDGIGTNQY